MKSFEFPLERILRWRAAQRAREEAKLKTLVGEQVNIQRQLQTLREEKRRVETSVADLNSLQGFDLRTLHGYRIRATDEQHRLMELLRRKDDQIAAQQRVYREAKRQCRLLEELKERRLTTWKYELGRELEEIAADSFTAKRSRETREQSAEEQNAGLNIPE